MKQIITNRGFLIIAAMIILIVVALMGAVAVGMYTKNVQSGTSYLFVKKAYYVAESGVDRAVYQFLNKKNPCAAGWSSQACCQAIVAQNVQFADGRYNLSTTFNSPTTPATLQQTIALGDNVTQLQLSSVSGYATSGRVVIGSEAFEYGNISGNILQNVTRAVGSSSMQPHAFGQQVLQQQCGIVVQAGVPDFSATASASGASTNTASVMAPELRFLLYSVGNDGAIAEFNGKVWSSLQYPNPQVFPTYGNLPDLNSISVVLNGAEGFIVGNGQGGNVGGDDQYYGCWNDCDYNWWWLPGYNWGGCNYTNNYSGWVPVFYLNTSLWGSETWKDKSVNLQGVGPIPSTIKSPLTGNSVAAIGNGVAWAVGNRLKINSQGYADLEDEDDQRPWWWYPGHCWHRNDNYHKQSGPVYQYFIVKIQCTNGSCTVSPAYPKPSSPIAGRIYMPANDTNNGNLVSISMLSATNGITGFAVDDNGNVLVYNAPDEWKDISWESGTLAGNPLSSVFVVSANEVWISGLNHIWKVTPSTQSGKWKFQSVPIASTLNDVVATIYMYDSTGGGVADDGWAFTSSGRRLHYQNVNGVWTWTDQGQPATGHDYGAANVVLNQNYGWVVGDGQNLGAYYNGTSWSDNNPLPGTTSQYNSIAKVVVDSDYFSIP